MEKITLVEKRKVVERDLACCWNDPLLAFPKWEVNFVKQILASLHGLPL
jgi:hypothetical protein